MKILCPGDNFDATGSSIFLAGPTPRSRDVVSWRPRALDILKELGFDGSVLVPERPDWSVKFNYDDQIEWEWDGLERCSVIAFWIPRQMQDMIGLTTNCEFGLFVNSGRAIYGRPDEAPHTRYLDRLYEAKTTKKPHRTLEGLLSYSVVVLKNIEG